ncbi:lantibiotic dehydratase C-terminal domain-containing protein, partial [Streptococcus equinus]
FLENVCPKHTVNKNSEKHKNMSLVQDYVNNCQIFEILPNLHELAQKVKKLSYNCKDFLEDYQYAIYDSIIHVHNNRLIGIDREKEEVIYDIIRGLVISEEFRNGMSNG